MHPGVVGLLPQAQPFEGVGAQPQHPRGEQPAGLLAQALAVGGGGDVGEAVGAGGVGKQAVHPLLGRVGHRLQRLLAGPRGGDGGDVRLDARGLGRVRRGDPGDGRTQIPDAVAGFGGGGDHGDLLQSVVLEQLLQGPAHRLAVGVGETVGLVEHRQGDRAVGGVGADEVVVDDAVGVLLRVGHPHQHIHLAGETGGDLPVDRLHRVEVRQIQEDERPGPGSEIAGAVAAVLHLEPVEQLLRTGRIPHRGEGGGGGGPAGGRLAQVLADDGVEQGGLAGTGGPEETDHGVLAGEPAPLVGGVGHPGQGGVLGGGEVVPAQGRGLVQRGEALRQRCFSTEHLPHAPVCFRTSRSAVSTASRSRAAVVPPVSRAVTAS